ncbi:FtsX-like permease family protein [Arthrobacter globiformis]|uniref:FtsX-like permease family protein n=1 Tax=Arthrobacter globiformis TaxID=1665 RepID=UPI0027D9152E|nr:FtsX-like permease family protein [Arthrobacter globiformis]
MALDVAPVPYGRWHSFRLALRMARRDISRHRGRSLLIILLILLPVAGMTGAAALAQSMQETPAERVQYQLGSTQARFRSMPASNAETVQDPVLETATMTRNFTIDPDFTPRNPRDAIPAGYEVLTETQLTLTVRARASHGGASDVPVMAKAVDALNPAFTRKYTLLQGRPAAARDEILVSPGALERFGIRLGDRLTTADGTFAVVGTLRDATYSDGNPILFLKPGQAAMGRPAQGSPLRETMYYLVGSKPVTWDQIRDLNRYGIAVLSRAVALDPPVPSGAAAGSGPMDAAGYVTGVLIGALALLEVGLLAGAAFAVGAKRQVRELALLAASGAEAPTVRAVVTAAGLWLGTIAVVAGAVLGAGGAAAVVGIARHLGSVRFPGFHLDILPTVAAMAMGLLACFLAAVVPARQVARQAVLGALKSGRAPAVLGPWPARVGVLLLVVAIICLAAGRTLGLTGDLDAVAARTPLVAALLTGGAVLAVVALVLLTGTFVKVLTARTAWLPLPLRMAARDSARNRSRTVPAVAAVLAAATLASAAMVLSASQMQEATRTHMWAAQENQVSLPLETAPVPSPGTASAPPIDPAAVAAALQRELSTVQWTQILKGPVLSKCDMQASADGSLPAKTDGVDCRQYKLAVPAGHECPATPQGRVLDGQDWRCNGSMFPAGAAGQLPPLVVGGVDELRALLGREPSPAAVEALNSGGVVVSNPVFEKDGKTTLQSYDVRQPVPGPGSVVAYKPQSNTVLPAVVEAPEVPVPFYGVIPPGTASKLGIHVDNSVLLAQLSAYPEAAEQDRASAALAQVYRIQALGFYVEPGADHTGSELLWLIVGTSALITLSAAGITTGLALADARADHMTLAGVGAPPRLRKALAGAQSLMTASLGTSLGVAAGVVPSLLLIGATRMFAEPVVPWLPLLALLVAVPLTGSALAWVFARARLPVSRRSLS